MQLLPWIDPTRLNLRNLCGNSNAIDYLMEWIREHPTELDNLNWRMLSENVNAKPILRMFPERRQPTDYEDEHWDLERITPEVLNPEEWTLEYWENIDWENVNWVSICRKRDPIVLPVLFRRAQQNPDSLLWDILSVNPTALPLLLTFPERIDWAWICKNTNPNVLPLLIERAQTNIESLNWKGLSANPTALPLIKMFPERIKWRSFCLNYSEDAIPLIAEQAKRNPNSLNWDVLSGNPFAIPLLEKHPDRIYYDYLSFNSAIFEDHGMDYVVK